VIKNKSGDEIQIGSVVTLKTGGEIEKFTMVDSHEADVFSNKLSVKSPLGTALVGKRKGDCVSIETPDGKTEYKITAIE